MNTQHIMTNFIAGNYQQVYCPQSEMTFLTNVFDYDNSHVLLEKRSLGLEYYRGAINEKQLSKIPTMKSLGVIDEEDNYVAPPSNSEVYAGGETDYRFIYLMEKLQHLEDEDATYFDATVKDLDIKNRSERQDILDDVCCRYNAQLATDIEYLYEFYLEHQGVLAWDLHCDNFMQRIDSGEIIILDPYTGKV